MDGDRIGSRIAALRTARGMTQRRLADEAHVSLSLLTKVETGKAPATPPLIGAVARALRVDVPRITGQPYEPGRGRGGRLLDSIEEIRRAVAAIDYPDDETPVRSRDDLAEDVRHLSELGQAANFTAIGAALPALLTDLSAALQAAPEVDRPALNSLLAEAYSGASAIATILGYLDFRDRVVDRIERASDSCDDPLRSPRTAWQRAAGFAAVGAHDAALRLLADTRGTMGDDPAGKEPAALSVYGSTFLRSAYIAARAPRTLGGDRAAEAWVISKPRARLPR